MYVMFFNVPRKEKDMKQLRILGIASLVLLLAAPLAMAQRPGGAVRGGIRGAMVGNLLGGSSGAQVGKAIGAVTGAVRRADYRADQRAVYQETQARGTYQATAQYQSGSHSNFRTVPPRVIVRPRVIVPPRVIVRPRR